MQENLQVGENAISGSLKKLTEGALVEQFGEGYFMALKFESDADEVKVGLDPSEGSGLVVLDEDMNGVFKVTNKDTQVFKTITTKNGVSKTKSYSLTGLVFAE